MTGKKMCFCLVLILAGLICMGASDLGFNWVDLQYRFKAGDAHLYRDIIELDVELFENNNLIRNQMRIIAEYRIKVQHADENGYHLLISFTELEVVEGKMIVSRDGQVIRTMDMVKRLQATMQPVVKEGFVQVTTDKWGAILEEQAAEVVREQLQGEFVEITQRVLLPMPKEEVFEFHAWQEPLIVNVPQLDIEVEIVPMYQLQGFQQYDGEDCVIIDLEHDDTYYLELKGGDTAEFKINARREVYFSLDKGWIVWGEEELDFYYGTYKELGQEPLTWAKGTMKAETTYLGLD